MKGRKRLWPGWHGLAAGALALAGCSGRPQAEPPPTGVVRVRAMTVRAEPVDEVYEAPGTVRARQRAVLASEVQGAVVAVRARLGESVRAGQELVEIEHRELDAEVERAQAAQRAAEEALMQAQRALQAAEAEANLAAVTRRRYEELFEKRSASRQELDQATARDEVAKAMAEGAQARLREAEARRREAAAALEGAQARRQDARLVAPFDGVIAERRVDPGSLAVPGMPLLTLEESGTFRLEVSVPESYVAAARVGARVPVEVPAVSLQAEGEVVEVEPAAEEGSRASMVRVSLPQREGLRSGMFGRALLAVGKTEVLTVSEEAVIRQGQLAFVYVAEEGRARRRLVTLGRQRGKGLEVLSGLRDGERVIIAPLEELTDGAAVEAGP